jgi:formylglycine-generating enzyme required for sulfatase activity/tRNA A-37 threonylcarbamoyl transferase component Bud32
VIDSTELAQQLGVALGDGYAVERTLGAGGFAVVFLVRDLALKRNLAVKVLSPDMITSKATLERFRREAETIAQLSHPNIVPLHFIGQRDDLLFLVMQCVEGGSIADRLQREGRLPVAEVVRITCEVAAALAHAHKRGVVHRDIKPANVLVDPESGRCLVSDFGIARTADATNLTSTGIMIGTPAYLSPEQITGEPRDHRVDIYALGVMAYEMLAGRVPFAGTTPTAAMMKRLAGPPEPVTLVRPEVPAELAAVITRCLAADPAERFASADEVIRAVGGEPVTTGGRAPGSGTAGRTPRLGRRRVLGGAAALIVVGVGGWWLMNGRLGAGRAAEVSEATARPVDSAMVSIGGGAYVIGSDSGPPIVRPRHTEHVDAFQIERTEVTVTAYEKYVSATRAPAPWGDAVPLGTLPVTRVPWGDAANYCAWKYPAGGRLPTELEWEAAARGLAGRAYPYGNVADAASANTASARRAGPAPVGSFPRGATSEGVQDMSGNVWEWTSSPLRAYPGARPPPVSMDQYRVIRGGAFDTSDSIATGWMRGYFKASASAAELPRTGFRCAISTARALR